MMNSREAKKNLTPKRHDVYEDVLVVTGRAVEGMRQHLHVDFLPILMASIRTAQLLTLWAHNRDHAGPGGRPNIHDCDPEGLDRRGPGASQDHQDQVCQV